MFTTFDHINNDMRVGLSRSTVATSILMEGYQKKTTNFVQRLR